MSDINRKQLYGFKIRANDAGISSAQIASQLGLAEATIVAWETGGAPVSPGQAAAYERAVKALGG